MTRKLLLSGLAALFIAAGAADWCSEHGVPESICTRCNSSLIAGFKAKGDWCAEHNLPESQCIACNPSLKDKLAAMAPAAGSEKAHDHDGDSDHKGHGHDHGHDDHGHADEVTLTPEAIERYGVRVAPVAAKVLSATFEVPARVTFNAEAMAHVGSVVEGRAIEIKARIGDVVKKGDTLLIVESPVLGEAQSEFLQKLAAEEVARAALEPAQSALDRARKLYEQDRNIALADLQRRESESRAAEGALKTAQAARTAAENKLHLLGMSQQAAEELARSGEINPKFAIRAPIDGQVIEREVTLGELVSPQEDALLVLADSSVLWAIAAVPESRLADVQVGAPVSVRVGNQLIESTISFVGPSLDPSTRTAQARIDLENPQNRIRAGMFATARITSGASDAQAVAAIPESAVQFVEGADAVFVPVEGEANTFAKRAVVLGPAVAGLRPVVSGVKVGDRIVAEGTFILKAELGKSGAAHEH